MGRLSRAMAMARVMGRLRPGQVLARLSMRHRQGRLGARGFEGVVPTRRQGLAADWRARLARWGGGVVVGNGLVEVAGKRLLANREWLKGGAGRPLRHSRELSRLELFYHTFLPGWKDGWGFVQGCVEEFPARTWDRVHEWHPYTVSNRLASWLGFLATAGPPDDAGLPERAAVTCRRMTDFVDWMPELDIGANHLLKNRWAVALSDVLLESSEARLDESVSAYLGEFSRQMLPDGAHFELCPMYHAKVLADALALGRALPAGHAAQGRLGQLVSLGSRWMCGMWMGSDGWANFNDSWRIPGLATELEAGLGAEALRPLQGVVHFRDSGFVRGNEAEGWRWILDVGGVGPSFNPGHGHSDVLCLALGWGDHPVLVDPGTLHYSPNDERAFLKSCHSHNGPCLADGDHTELVGSFRIGRAARGEGRVIDLANGRVGAEGWHRGYAGWEMRRVVGSEGRGMWVDDRWRHTHGMRRPLWARWLLPVPVDGIGGVEVGESSVRLRWPTGHPLAGLAFAWELSGWRKARLSLGESMYSAEFGRSMEAVEVIATGEAAGAEASARLVLDWTG